MNNAVAGGRASCGHGCHLQVPHSVIIVVAAFLINGLNSGVFYVGGLYLQFFLETGGKLFPNRMNNAVAGGRASCGHGCHLQVPHSVIIVVAAFLINGLNSGVFYVGGLYLQFFLETFDAGKVATAGMISLQGSFCWFSGIMTGPLIVRFGTRNVAVAGALASTVGIGLSSVAFHIVWLYVFYAILSGVGFGLLIITNSVCVQQHTNKQRALAGGLALCGTGFGVVIMPQIAEWAMLEYSWRGSLLILSGVMLNSLPCALLLLPPATIQTEHTKFSKENKNILPESNLLIEHSDEKKPRFASIDTPVHNNLSDAGVSVSDLPVAYGRSVSLSNIVCQQQSHADGLLKVNNSKRHNSIMRSLKTSLLPTTADGDRIGFTFVMALSIAILFFFHAGLPISYLFCTMKALSIGLGQAEAAMLLSLGGIGDISGRVVGSLISPCHDKMPMAIFMLNTILSGLSCGMIGACTTYLHMMVSLLSFGITIGMATSMWTTVIRDLVGIQHFTLIMGYACAAGGLGNIILIQLVAAIWEKTNDISIPFSIGGSCLVMAGLLMIGALIALIQNQRKDTHMQSRSEDQKVGI